MSTYTDGYFAIETGREGDRPRTLHGFPSARATTRTMCGLRTDNCVSVHYTTNADALCEQCFPEGAS